MTPRTALAVLILVGFPNLVAGTPRDSLEFSECRSRFEHGRDPLEGYLCLRGVGRASGELEMAIEELGRIDLVRGPDPRSTLTHGLILADLGDPRAINDFESAAGGCRAIGSDRCEVIARLELAVRIRRWDPEKASVLLARADEVASLSTPGDLPLRVRAASAWNLLKDDEPSAAAIEFEAILDEVVPDLSTEVRASALEGLGNCAWSTGRLRESREHFRNLLDLARGTGDIWLAARAEASFILLDLQVENPEPSTVRRLVARAVDRAHDASNPIAELKLLVLHAQTLPVDEQAEGWLRVQVMAERLGALEDELLALRYLARIRMEEGDADGAIGAMDEARRIARSNGLRDAEIRSCAGGLELLWTDGRLEEARRQIGDCLELIDGLRNRQPSPVERARVTARFSYIPRNAADALLGLENDVQAALCVLERFRAGSLVEIIGKREGDPSPPPEEIIKKLAEIQAELAYGRPTGDRRRHLLGERDRLETPESQLTQKSEATDLAPVEIRLSRLQKLLTDDEALIVFSMLKFPTTFWETTGCWAIVITSTGARAVRLPGLDTTGPAIDALAGLLDRTDDVFRAAASRVHELVFADLLVDLENTRHLIVLLDDPIHELPLAALRASPESPPLISRFDIQLIPSLGMWQEARRTPGGTAPSGAAIVVANPGIPGTADTTLREANLPVLAELGNLPGASEEGAMVARILGPNTQLLEAGTATETALRAALFRPPQVLHIAAHAVIDSRRPEHSAIVLAPGDGHDGLLQPREIADLGLDRTLVVLSACRSLDGEMVDGDGVTSLGRAFLAAGAGAVVGAVRPLEDRRTVYLMSEFYRNLDSGVPVAQALADAQTTLAARGRPAAEWATVLLVGDGTLRVTAGPHVSDRRMGWLSWAGALVLITAVGFAFVLWGRRREDGG